MDQTKNNMDRIRAFDAEEGEWRTINGAHVLIKNGRIAGGAGGALNGQPFRGGSLKKMQAGSKGSKFNENRERASIREAVKSPLYGTVPAGLNVERAEFHPHYDPNRRYTVTKGRQGRRGRHDDPRRFNVLEGARPISTNWYGTIFEADHKHLTVPRHPLGPYEGTARLEPSKAELAARARSLKERRPDLFKAGRKASPASPASRLTKMPGGHKGMESGAYGRRLESQAKEVAGNNRAIIASVNAKHDRNRNERLKQMGNLMAKASKWPDHSPLKAIYRNAYEALAREDQREGRATAATTHALNQEMFDLEGKAARHESHRGEVASRAQRALERYRKSREAERGGASAPQQSAPHATKLGRMQPGSTAVNAGKEAKRLDHNARVYHRTARRAREAYNAKMDKAIAEQEALRQKAIGKLNSNALGVRAYAESHRRAETPEQATHKAAQYIKLGNKYRDKYRGMKESAENKQNEIERKKNDYKMKSYENVSRRDQEADNAKERLARMRKLAKALKARRPGSFKG